MGERRKLAEWKGTFLCGRDFSLAWRRVVIYMRRKDFSVLHASTGWRHHRTVRQSARVVTEVVGQSFESG